MARQHVDIQCNVKRFRMAKGWSQGELADKVGVRRQAIYDVESGRYLPNTAISLRMARIFGCRVEDLFMERTPQEAQPVHVLGGEAGPSKRLALGRVRERLVGLPLQGEESLPFGFRSADGLLDRDGKRARVLLPSDRLEQTVILMGCDPAFEILCQHVSRAVHGARIHCRFASSHQALDGLAGGVAHVAGTHLHNTGAKEANVALARRKLMHVESRILGFSLMEEGLMVAQGNPMNIRTVADLGQPMVRFVNREAGAALRVLLDDQLKRSGVSPDAVNGYRYEAGSHREGAYRIACGAADAALGLKAVAEVYGLDFVPITVARCDLVIPVEFETHPTVRALMDALQSAALRNEIDALPGYDGAATGKVVAEYMLNSAAT